MKSYISSNPEHENIVLEFPDRQVSLRHWKEYAFLSHFLTAADGWSFTTTKPEDTEIARALAPGELVRLRLNDHVLSTGYVDSVNCTTSRTGGTELRIEGRDKLGQVVDANVDPKLKIKEGDTLANVMQRVFAPFGWSKDEDFALAEETDEDALSTDVTGVKRTKKKGVPLKSFQLKQHQPVSGEGAFQFAARVANRQGLWIWLSADGETVIVGKPSFDLGAVFYLHVATQPQQGSGTVISSSVHQDLTGQPSVIVAEAFGGGGDVEDRGRITAYAMNPNVRVKGQFEDTIPKRFPGAKKVDLFPQPTAFVAPFERMLYLHDSMAQNLGQLQHFLRRELSLIIRNALKVRCTVEGHGQEIDGTFVPWTINTVAHYTDESAGIDEDLWILSREFKRSVSGGSTTDLELIRLNTLSF